MAGSKVKDPLYSRIVTQAALLAAVLALRQLQRWAWERVGREKLLLRCRLHGRARHVLRRPRGEERGGAYRGGRPLIQLVKLVIHNK